MKRKLALPAVLLALAALAQTAFAYQKGEKSRHCIQPLPRVSLASRGC